MSIENLVRYFGAVEDPRCSGKVEHRLLDILVIAVSAVIACAESWDDIALYGRSKLAWLKTFLELPNGIPSHDTFRRVFMLIDPDAFEAGFTAWVGSLAARFEREVIAIDGKTIRRSFDHGREQSPLHVVSAWASEQGLVLGQRCVDGKSNEITAVPELLDQLALQNSIVTLDAMGCQTAIAEKILARGGDYLLTLKGNHKLAHKAVVEHFEQHCFRRGAPGRADCDAFDDTHGRLVRRRAFASTEAASLDALSGWPGLRSVLAVESIRSVNTASSKVETEIRYFLSSCPDGPAVLGQAVRAHWAVENALHWVLDVTFREDDSRVRDRTAARNLALLRQHAVPLDKRGIAHLSGNSLGLDLYTLFAYRLPRLQRDVHLRWHALQGQIGSNEAQAFNLAQRIREVMPEVLTAYPHANVEITSHGLLMKPSKSAVPKAMVSGFRMAAIDLAAPTHQDVCLRCQVLSCSNRRAQ